MPVPRKLNHFELQEEIGRGGMGSVWRAKDPSLDREVAIKVLRDDLAGDPKFVADFLQEARNAAAISHPHIAQVHLVGDAGGQYYIVMELLRGHSLSKIIETEGQLGEERALDITIQVADALRAAYKRQMIHGDIKPANVFITEDRDAKVLDFGLAKLANVEVADAGGGIWGSPYYISPERVGQKAEDFRSDVYSLGATLFHALAGRPPFDAEDPAQLAVKRLNEKPPLLRDLNPKVTAKTEQVVNKMLNKSIMMRYLDYDALLEDLNEAKREATAKRLGVDLHPEQFQPPEPAPPPTRKSPLPRIIGGVLSVIIIAALALFFWQKIMSKARVIVDHNTNSQASPAFEFKNVPSLSTEDDVAIHGRFAIVDGNRDGNSGELSKLNDGRLPTEQDQPSENFFFARGTKGGRLQLDLDSVVKIKQVNTYSWHPNTRGPQVYQLYASDGTAKDFNAMPREGTDLEKAGWKHIAEVNTKPNTSDWGGQYGVSISNTFGALGKYRYLLFIIAATENNDDNGNTFYSEIAVIEQK